jgi:glycosyltransferase involved in cell wall biosynthesis
LNDIQEKIFTYISSHPAYNNVKLEQNKKESISVVIAHYNQQVVLKETIESILSQSHEPLEILIIDDLSTDREYTRSITDCYLKYGKVKVFYPTEKLYLGGAREFGMHKAAGDIIQFFDSDDIMHPQRLEIIKGIFNENSNASLIVSGFIPFTGAVPPVERYDKNNILEALIPPKQIIDDMAKRFSKSKLSFIDSKTKKVPWYAWGAFGAVGATYGCASGNPAILSDCRKFLRWNTPKQYIFTPYEDYEYCFLLLALTGGAYHVDLPLTYYRRGYTTSMPQSLL